MCKKIMLPALVAVSAAMFALPALASAGTWHAEPSTEAIPITTTTAGHGATKLVTPARVTECTANPSSTGSGQIDVGGTTGKITLSFFGCKSSGTTCTTPGQAAGTIKTSSNLITHNILLEPTITKFFPPQHEHIWAIPGIKITGVGESTQLAHYTCGFGLVTVNVTGTVIGEVEQDCGTKQSTISVNFNAPGGTQEWMQETTTGNKTDLTATVNGTPETAGQTGTGTISTGAQEKTITCT